METATQTKNERINLRLESGVKRLIERAAGFEGKTVSNFILNSALVQAKKTVQEHEVISLNAENSRSFVEALSVPVRFNKKLIEALEDHARHVDSK